ncbi:cytochrome P450 89A2 [Ricinus communis]|uniref:cytochrome P450 89A2 n=1 Tax=Ricinus communis TaxID=3988 RepID=UPI00201B33C7|nr:cytochrome P450 89A2 [Ricinus communis]
METWFIIIISLLISALIKALFSIFFQSKKHSLPPNPVNFPIIRNILWFRKSFSELEPIIRSFHKDIGPIITLHIGFYPNIFIADHSLAHQALVQNGAIFADRPRALAANNVGLSVYGPTWRLLRRNLMSEILHTSRVKSYSHARKWVLEILLNRFKSQSECGHPVLVADNFQYAMFCLLVLMCFGDKLDQKQIEEIQRVEELLFANFERLEILNLWPSVTKILFRKRWSEFLQLEKEREDVIIPLIRARKSLKEERQSKNSEDQKDDNEYVLSYVDTLLDLQLPDEKRKLTEKEMVVLCNEFLNAGTDTATSSLQWIMANLVKYPHIQEKLFMEIKGVVTEGEEMVKEDDLQKMPYLKAVILEGLRRHPPVHFTIPHAVTEDVVLDKYAIPKNAQINFMVADMGLDPKVWEDPMAFKPERFISGDINGAGGEVFDITGSREIKMMPFGVGRRICPAYGLAILQLEYFVANLVWSFEWKAIDGDDVDLSEVLDFIVNMKNPLQAHISPRLNRGF